ncbi:MAG: hypothetical protein HUU15_03920 [Candidatus Brocadiae bacterium]|nr:hypothetical protein [Candidatus Brocadiia bacterium]
MRKIGMLGLWILSAAAAGAQTLEERVQVLEKHLEGGDGEAPDPGSPAAQALSKKIEVFFSEGLKFRSGDSNFEAHIGGRVIFHGRFFNSENERGKRDTFGFRQVKLNMQGRIWQDWTFKVELSTTGTPVALDDGYVGFEKWTWLKLWAGQFKAPQSLEELTSTRFIDLPERSCLNRLVQGRDVGLMVHGEPVEKLLGYQVMLANGNGRNGPDENSDKDVFTRVWVRPLATALPDSRWFRNLHFGASVNYGRRDLAANTLPYTFQSIFNQTTFANAGAALPSIKFDDSRWRYAGEFAWLFGPGSIKAEYLRTNDQFTNLNNGTHHHTHITSYVVSATVLVTGEDKTWDRIRPDRPLFGSAGGFGAVELAARFGRFEFNRDMLDKGYLDRDTSARVVDEVAVGINWFPNMNTRVSVAYAYEKYRSDAHTDPILISGRRKDHCDVFLFRVQVDF